MNVETIRSVTIRASTEGVTEATAQVRGLGQAYDGMSNAASTNATVTDIASKRQLSAAAAYQRQTLAVVEGARQQDQLARASKIVDSALQQNIITTDQHAARMSLLNEKYGASTSALSSFKEGLGQATAFLGQFGVAIGVAELISFGREVFQSAASLENQARVAGVSMEALQAFRLEMREGGLETSDADQIVRRFTRSLGDARDTAGPARQALFDLSTTGKVGFADLNYGAETVLPKVAAALLAIQDPARRAHDEIALFGKSGQEIEGALSVMASSTATAEDRARALGLLLGSDVARQAHDADVAFEEASERLSIAFTPAVVDAADAASGLLNAITRLADADSVWDKLLKYAGYLGPIFQGYGLGISAIENAANGPPKPANSNAPQPGFERSQYVDAQGHFNLPGGSYGAIDGIGVNVKQLDDLNAKALQQKALVGDTASKRAQDLAVMQAGEIALKEMGDASGHIFTTQAAINAIEAVYGKAKGDEVVANIRNGAELKQQATVHDHIKETFAGYLAQLGQAADVAGKTTVERENEAAVIKGAVVAEREHGVAAKNVSKTYAEAVGYLRESGAALVVQNLDLGRVASVQSDINQKIDNARALLGLTNDQREVEIQYQQILEKSGKAAADAARDKLNTEQGITRELAAQARAEALLNPYKDDKKTIAAIRATAGSGAQANLAIGQTGLGQAMSGLDQGLGGDMGGPGDKAHQQGALRALRNEVTARQNIVKDALDAELITRQQAADRFTAIEDAASRQRIQIAQAETQERLSFASDFFGNLATLAQSSNATLAAIGKAAAITQATIDGLLAVQKALASYPPPYNFIMAAAIGVATAANVAKIAGFEQGGYTGNGGRSDIAGVVHGQEFVVNAGATAANRSVLEAMNRGQAANSNSPTVKVTINNNAGVSVTQRRMSDDEILVTIDEVSTANVHKHGGKMLQNELSSPNSRGSEAVRLRTGAKR